jgi:hypothetical protein
VAVVGREGVRSAVVVGDGNRAVTATVSVAGLNAKLSILIALPEEDAALLDDEPPLGVGAFAVPDPPQPATKAAAAATTTSELRTCRGFMLRRYGRRREGQDA